jgi:tRNA dimethylallyltransferase
MNSNRYFDLPVICLLGPTASGKTELALKLSKEFPLDIINVDSAQIYRGMDIGTAKPSKETLDQYPHRLIDILDPEKSYSVGNFIKDANIEIKRIHNDGRIPLLVGGTMLYFHALIEGLSDLPEGDKNIRNIINTEAKLIGWPEMHNKLADIDHIAAKKINPHDSQRIQRALEVFELSGRNITDWQFRNNKNNDYRFIKFAINHHSRIEIHQRINARFLRMLDEGFIQEVQLLKQREYLTSDHSSMRAVGYRQIWAYLDDLITIEEATKKAQASTRQLAKRQITWLRNTTSAIPVDLDGKNVMTIINSKI